MRVTSVSDEHFVRESAAPLPFNSSSVAEYVTLHEDLSTADNPNGNDDRLSTVDEIVIQLRKEHFYSNVRTNIVLMASEATSADRLQF